MYYLNEVTNSVECLNIDIISDYEGSTAGDLKRCFRFLMQLERFKKVSEEIFTEERDPQWIIWSDCGTQFRCAEFNYFLFNELADQGISVSMNWFAEKHGKNMRDQHFSVINNALKYSAQELKSISVNAQEVVDRLNRHFKMNEILRMDVNGIPDESKWCSKAFYFNPPKQEITDAGIREVKYISCYYNLKNVLQDGRFEFYTTIFSNLETLIPVDSTVDGPKMIKININCNPAENQIIDLTNEEKRTSVQENIGKKKRFIFDLQKKYQSNFKKKIIF